MLVDDVCVFEDEMARGASVREGILRYVVWVDDGSRKMVVVAVVIFVVIIVVIEDGETIFLRG